MKKFSKIFLEMTPLKVKTCGESEFDIFEAKKRFPDSRKTHCVQKCNFCDFSLQYTGLPWIKEAFFRFENVKLGFLACFYL
jgi:hypothetical protein